MSWPFQVERMESRRNAPQKATLSMRSALESWWVAVFHTGADQKIRPVRVVLIFALLALNLALNALPDR